MFSSHRQVKLNFIYSSELPFICPPSSRYKGLVLSCQSLLTRKNLYRTPLAPSKLSRTALIYSIDILYHKGALALKGKSLATGQISHSDADGQIYRRRLPKSFFGLISFPASLMLQKRFGIFLELSMTLLSCLRFMTIFLSHPPT